MKNYDQVWNIVFKMQRDHFDEISRIMSDSAIEKIDMISKYHNERMDRQ